MDKYLNRFDKVIKEMQKSRCKYDQYFIEQQKLHPNLRSVGCMLVCNCKKCLAQRGSL